MKIKSVSGHSCRVRDLDATVAFYEKLGFTTKVRDSDHATLYMNWYWIDFTAGDPASDSTVVPYLSVDNVQEAYDQLKQSGIQPESEPQTIGINREFAIRDPNGYRLVIFKRK